MVALVLGRNAMEETRTDNRNGRQDSAIRVGLIAGLACALLAGSFQGASADTRRNDEIRATSPLNRLATALYFERAYLSALTRSTTFEALTGLPTAPEEASGRRDEGAVDAAQEAQSSLADLQQLDMDTARAIGSAQERASEALFGADSGGALGLDRVETVAVGKPTPEWRCLSEAIYFEARGESLIGQFAVAEVILNRRDSEVFPDTVCDVVGQGAQTGRACQFSYKCDGKSDRPSEKRAFERIGRIAWIMLQGKPRILTGMATYYHTTAVNPSWARKFIQTAKIGVHLFYRPDNRLSLR